jgi:hypothetical protein
MVQVSIQRYKASPFERETHDIDQQALREVVYPTVCSKTQTEIELPRSELLQQYSKIK